MATDAPAPPEAEILGRRHRITVDEYHRMIEAGAFGPGGRVELLEGVVVDKMGKNPPHMLATDLLQYAFIGLLPPGFFVTMGNAVTIAERDSEPEPDLSVLRGEMRDYAGRRRTPRDAALVIEVSDTSYAIDRHAKARTYAAAGIPVYWIVDLNRRRLEVLTDPAGSGDAIAYARVETLGPDDAAPILLDGREAARLPVREILP